MEQIASYIKAFRLLQTTSRKKKYTKITSLSRRNYLTETSTIASIGECTTFSILVLQENTTLLISINWISLTIFNKLNTENISAKFLIGSPD